MVESLLRILQRSSPIVTDAEEILKLIRLQPGLTVGQIARSLGFKARQVTTTIYRHLTAQIRQDGRFRWWPRAPPARPAVDQAIADAGNRKSIGLVPRLPAEDRLACPQRRSVVIRNGYPASYPRSSLPPTSSRRIPPYR